MMTFVIITEDTIMIGMNIAELLLNSKNTVIPTAILITTITYDNS